MDIESCLARHARRPPERWALTCEGRTFSYRAFKQAVNRLVDSLAGCKIPRAVFLVDQLPRKASGKVLKYKLRSEFAGKAGSMGAANAAGDGGER